VAKPSFSVNAIWYGRIYRGSSGALPPVISGFRRETLGNNYFKGGSYSGRCETIGGEGNAPQ